MRAMDRRSGILLVLALTIVLALPPGARAVPSHAEIHLYNPQHPRGRRYRPQELRGHRDQWLELCKTSAQFLASVPPTTDVGPIQALIDELEFNRTVAARHDVRELGAPMDVGQFDRSVGAGGLSLITEDVKNSIFGAYVAIKRANTYVSAIANFARSTDAGAQAVNNARDALRDSVPYIDSALEALRQHLAREA